MKLFEIRDALSPVFSFEFYPPKTEKGEQNLYSTAQELKILQPGFFSMTYGAGGSTRDKTVELGSQINRDTGVDTVCHVTCVDQSREDVRNVIQQIRDHDLNNIMALRGDPPAGVEKWQPHPEGFHYAVDLVREIRKHNEMGVAVAGFPESHPDSPNRESDLKFMKEKIDAGADVVVTQLFFDNNDFMEYDRTLKSMGVETPIIPGILPIQSVSQVRRFTSLCKSKIPAQLNDMLNEVDGDDDATQDLGIEYAARQIEQLLDYGVPGIHIYCLNKAELPIRIFKKLGLLASS